MIYRIVGFQCESEKISYDVAPTAWREGNTLFLDGRAIAGLIDGRWIAISTMALLPALWTEYTVEAV